MSNPTRPHSFALKETNFESLTYVESSYVGFANTSTADTLCSKNQASLKRNYDDNECKTIAQPISSDSGGFFDSRSQRIEPIPEQKVTRCCSILEGSILLITLTLFLCGSIAYYVYTASNPGSAAIANPFLLPVLALFVYYMFFLYSVLRHIIELRTSQTVSPCTTVSNNITPFPLYLRRSAGNVSSNTLTHTVPIYQRGSKLQSSPEAPTPATRSEQGCLVYEPHEIVATGKSPVVTSQTIAHYINSFRNAEPSLSLCIKVTNMAPSHKYTVNTPSSQEQVYTMPVEIDTFTSLCPVGEDVIANYLTSQSASRKCKITLLYTHSFDVAQEDIVQMRLVTEQLMSTLTAQISPDSTATNTAAQGAVKGPFGERSIRCGDFILTPFWEYCPDVRIANVKDISNSVNRPESQSAKDDAISPVASHSFIRNECWFVVRWLLASFSHTTLVLSTLLGLLFIYITVWSVFHRTVHIFEVKSLKVRWGKAIEKAKRFCIEPETQRLGETYEQEQSESSCDDASSLISPI